MKPDSFRDFVLEQLRTWAPVICRPMFGGYGLYCGRIFFAIIHKGRLFFKVSDESRSQYEEMGAKPFEPKPGDVMRSYYEVPVDVLENPTMLQEWADLALTIME